jgi:hypothetical protein
MMVIPQLLADGLHQTMTAFGAGLAQSATYVWGCISIAWLLVAGFAMRNK